ncbi:MAG: phytase, partial [Halieaceae bacterium]|nr:phytase [Halieaceae bacterium]
KLRARGHRQRDGLAFAAGQRKREVPAPVRDALAPQRHLADVEGLAIYYGPAGSGYLIASNQGADNFALYERSANNRFLGFFHVVADALTGIDGISETDGLDVTSASLGAHYPDGLFVAQDGRNISPDQRQNFKLVPWRRISRAMGLKQP